MFCVYIGLNLRGLNNSVSGCIRKASSPKIRKKRSEPKINTTYSINYCGYYVHIFIVAGTYHIIFEVVSYSISKLKTKLKNQN